MVRAPHLHTFTAGDTGSVPGQGTKILQAAWLGQKKKKIELKGWVFPAYSVAMFPTCTSLFPWEKRAVGNEADALRDLSPNI